jgi:hypothetical protein
VDLIEQSLRQTEAPFVYGVLGDWGTGKTSILQMLQTKLEADQERRPIFVPIWFDAWKYENEANIIYPLLYAIQTKYQKEMRQEYEESFNKTLKQVVATSAFVLGDIGLRAATKYLTDEAIGLAEVQEHLETVQKQTVDKLEKVLRNWANEVNHLHDAFEALLDTYAEAVTRGRFDAKEIRFVFLIDDLDRCLPETTIAILESIKNFLLVKNSIFVLALNAKVVYQGIKAKYQGLDIDGREYLEKILNYSFYVPEPALDQVKVFATGRLNDLLVDDQDRGNLESYLSEFGTVLEGCKFNNPRKIKRILNRYLLFISRYETEFKTKAFNLTNVVRLLVLAEYYPVLFNLLYGSDKPQEVIDNVHHNGKYTELEKAYDITIPKAYPPLFSLKTLFELQSLSLREELQAVFGLTRMI